jgi:hypothetical protein
MCRIATVRREMARMPGRADRMPRPKQGVRLKALIGS